MFITCSEYYLAVMTEHDRIVEENAPPPITSEDDEIEITEVTTVNKGKGKAPKTKSSSQLVQKSTATGSAKNSANTSQQTQSEHNTNVVYDNPDDFRDGYFGPTPFFSKGKNKNKVKRTCSEHDMMLIDNSLITA